MSALDHAVKDRPATVALARRVAGIAGDDPTPEAGFDEAAGHGALSPGLEVAPAKLAWLRDRLARAGRLPAGSIPPA